MKRMLLSILKVFCILTCLIIYCEFLNYYVVLSQCHWPALNPISVDSTAKDNGELRALVISDTHLLGFVNGYYLDRVLRDWQMHRAFQTAMYLHKPEVVFVLGDLTNEGEYCNEEDFQNFVKRFYSVFAVPHETRMHVVVGNHDIGFHYTITSHLNQRFVKGFNASAVQLITIKENHFVLVNSMGLQGDDCFLCKATTLELQKLERILNCSKSNGSCGTNTVHKYSRPILITHFPLYRESDQFCDELDEAPYPEKVDKFKEGYDCLNQSSTQKLLKQIEPRLVLTGHTHHGCTSNLSIGNGVEITIPSFTWRNKNNPSYGLFVFTPTNYAFSKCLMPQESTVIFYYVMGATILTVWFIYKHASNRCKYRLLKYNFSNP